MKTPCTRLLAATLLFAAAGAALAQGTAFTYQGDLTDSGQPANNTYDLTFTLWSASSTDSGHTVGVTFTNLNTPVTNGLFNVSLDFSASPPNPPGTANPFNGTPLWLQIGVRLSSSAPAGVFTEISPLQPIQNSPYAIFANTASNLSGNLAAADLSGTYGNALTLDNTNNSFAGNGAGLTGVNAATVDGFSAAQFWNLTGNTHTIPGVNFVGTTDNEPLQLWANGSRALLLDGTANAAQPNVIGGSSQNAVEAVTSGATIGGGVQNIIESNIFYSTIAGGAFNTIESGASGSIIAGGGANVIQTGAYNGTIAGGSSNMIQTEAYNSTIAGGDGNVIQIGDYSSTIGGGDRNTIHSGAADSTIAGGYENIIQSDSYNATIAGGNGNIIQSNSGFSSISGGSANQVYAGSPYSLIAGGGGNTIYASNSASAIAGGSGNTIDANNDNAFIGGGYLNQIFAPASFATIGGGLQNYVLPGGDNAMIPGGSYNTASGLNSFAAGETADAGDDDSFVWSDGTAIVSSFGANTFTARAIGGFRFELTNSTVAIGTSGTVSATALALPSIFDMPDVIYSGSDLLLYADNDQNFFGGNAGNSTMDGLGGWYNTALGYVALPVNTTGLFNTAAGDGALFANTTGSANTAVGERALGENTTGWANISLGVNAGLNLTTGNNNIDIGNEGNAGESYTIRIGTEGIQTATYLVGPVYATSFNSTSDRNAKENLRPVDNRSVLAKVASLPVTRWNFKNESKDVQHIGPMAQDFQAAFQLSADDKHISVVDEGGVALAAIQGLNQKLNEKDAEIQTLKQQNDSLADRLNELEAMVKEMAAHK